MIPTAIIETAIKYFIEKSTPIIIDNITEFISTIKVENINKLKIMPSEISKNLPSAGIIGIGRCGSNISILVAKTFSEIATLTDNEASPKAEQKSSPEDINILNWLRIWNKKDVLLISDKSHPVIIIADLNKETFTRVEPLKNAYAKLKLLSYLENLQEGGAGNLPILGQYVGRIILNIGANNQNDDRDKRDWKLNRTYFIDSVGSDFNPSRLFFFVFSTGGGSGSGMAPEFGLAQQYAYNSKVKIVLDQDVEAKDIVNPLRFQPVCSLGIGILPSIDESGMNNAVYLNSGRLLCRYLAQENRFKDEFSVDDNNPRNMQVFNGLILVSNDIMRWVANDENFSKSKEKEKDATTTVVEAEHRANQYVAQQIFNLLTSQAIGADQVNNRLDGIDPGDTISLDANDLVNSLNGPIAVAYAETKTTGLNVRDLLLRAISMPRKNQETSNLEGISVLPVPRQNYEKLLETPGEDLEHIANLPLFKRANSVVTIISVPKSYNIAETEVRRLRALLSTLFPNAKIRRYALVKGVSEKYVSFTVFVSGSACTCSEIYAHVLAYIESCFGSKATSIMQRGEFRKKISDVVRAPDFDPKNIEDLLSEYESMDAVIAGVGGRGQWERQRGSLEANYRSNLGAAEFLPIDQVRLSKLDVIEALKYINANLYYTTILRPSDDETDLSTP